MSNIHTIHEAPSTIAKGKGKQVAAAAKDKDVFKKIREAEGVLRQLPDDSRERWV